MKTKCIVKNTSVPESTISKDHKSIIYHVVRESSVVEILWVGKEDIKTNLKDTLSNFVYYSRKQAVLRNILWGN